MVQLILDVGGYEITLPESRSGGYTVSKEPLETTVQMISGRTVREVRGNVWNISYQYGFFKQADLQRLMEVCDKGIREPITCSFLPQESAEEMETARFWVESYDRPKFMWSREGQPLWADFSIRLQGVTAVD